MTVDSQGTATADPQDAPGRAAGKSQTPPPPSGPKEVLKPSRGRRSLPSGWLPYLLVAPALLSMAVLLLYPLIRNVILSFQELNRKEFITRETVWTGFDNYTELLGDPDFWTVVVRSVVFTAVNVALIMAIGTGIGLLLNRLGKKMRLVLSLALMFAWAMPIVASVTVFRWLFDEQFGVVNWLMRTLGFDGYEQHNWFETGFSTLVIIMILLVWGSIPFVALNMYAALTTIGSELYEAAKMDGASGWRTFWAVVFPNLKSFFMITTFLEIIWIFKAFAQVYAMNQGGPDRGSETLPVFAYIEGVGQFHYGVAAAISILTIVMLIAVMSFYFRLILKQEEEL
ncbi:MULTISPECIES: carbohydrate ABC transporter permease [unclassified Streptomyces]|uniref:carbohydrate ABC transporter permease n=1 Tax=unclassified Streptomyces TaxID=2593676 RepID=UPI00093CBBB9|nr:MULTISPECIES: sugar ABC transporter permease [unclassified Streptomyces]MCD2464499.1 sugar ABC transporter permease [Streptomyces sp. MBT42]OKJ56812.1 sugar ABC transporter permease [Streptomyces sp. CB02009]